MCSGVRAHAHKQTWHKRPSNCSGLPAMELFTRPKQNVPGRCHLDKTDMVLKPRSVPAPATASICPYPGPGPCPIITRWQWSRVCFWSSSNKWLAYGLSLKKQTKETIENAVF